MGYIPVSPKGYSPILFVFLSTVGRTAAAEEYQTHSATMHWYRRVVAVALVVLPAVDAFCAPATRHTTYRTPGAVPRCCSTRGQTRGEHELSTSRSAALTMQGGAGYGGGGGGKFPLDNTYH